MLKLKLRSKFILMGLFFSSIIFLFFTNNFVYSQQVTEWKNYSSKNLGITFELPNIWEVKEKASRFDEGPDLIAKNGLNSFSITKPIPNDPSYQSELETFVNFWNPNFALSEDNLNIRNIEGFSFDNYKIDNRQTASALYVIDIKSGERLVNQVFLVKTEEGIFQVDYRDISTKFDSLNSQSTLDRILNGLKITPGIGGLIYNLTTPVVSGAKHIGSENATIDIIEFGDYQCPFCARFNQETKDQLVSKYVDTGIVRFGFKDLVINDLPKDKLSTLAAEASYCAAEQDKYWDYHDEVYRNSKGENTGWISKISLIGFAKNVNVTDITKFTECLDSHKYNQQVAQNDEFAKSLGVATIPTFFILMENSKKIAAIEGAQPFIVFEDTINQFLNGTM